jgi:hypothetical protein
MYGQNKINKIEISYVHWGITTFCLVDCNEFDKAFNIDNIKKNYIISDSLIIASIDRKISKIMQHKKIIDDVAVDTRLKMRFYSDEKLIRTICIGTISIQINGAVYSGVYDTDPEVEELRDLLDKVSALYTFLKQEKY